MAHHILHRCWFDRHTFTGKVHHYPTSYDGITWQLGGVFCSVPCVKAYLQTNRDTMTGALELLPRMLRCLSDGKGDQPPAVLFQIIDKFNPCEEHGVSIEDYRLTHANTLCKCEIDIHDIKTKRCWYDGMPMNTPPVYVPWKYDGTRYHVFGYFCSVVCAKRFCNTFLHRHSGVAVLFHKYLKALGYSITIDNSHLFQHVTSYTRLGYYGYKGGIDDVTYRDWTARCAVYLAPAVINEVQTVWQHIPEHYVNR